MKFVGQTETKMFFLSNLKSTMHNERQQNVNKTIDEKTEIQMKVKNLNEVFLNVKKHKKIHSYHTENCPSGS